MTLILKNLFNFFKMLNSETGTNQIAAGMTCGFILGMTPAFSLQTLLVFSLVFVFRIQFGAAMVTAFFFKFAAFFFDPLFHSVGSMVLEHESLKAIWTTLYHMPIVPLTRFNNSIVMGSGVFTLILSPVAFFIFRTLVVKYREKVVQKFQESKFFKALKATAFYKWYVKYDDLYGS